MHEDYGYSPLRYSGARSVKRITRMTHRLHLSGWSVLPLASIFQHLNALAESLLQHSLHQAG